MSGLRIKAYFPTLDNAEGKHIEETSRRFKADEEDCMQAATGIGSRQHGEHFVPPCQGQRVIG